MPVGKVWSRKHDPTSNLGLLIRGLAFEFYRLDLKIQEVSEEIDVNQTVNLIEEWERSVGIPDTCIQNPNIYTLEERRSLILYKLSNFGGVQTAEDFENLASIFGINVEIIPGADVAVFPLGFPIRFSPSATAATHSIFVNIIGASVRNAFPLPFPMPFSSEGITFLQCIFRRLAPANVEVYVTRM